MTYDDLVRANRIYDRTMAILDRLFPAYHDGWGGYRYPRPISEQRLDRDRMRRKCRQTMFPIIHKRITEKVEQREQDF